MASPDPCAPPLSELRGGWQALSDARAGVAVAAGGLGYAPHPFFNAKNFLDQQTLVYFLSEQHVLSESYREGANKPDRLVQFTTRTSMSEALQTLADYRILSGPILDAASGEYMGLADVGALLGALIEEVYGASLVGADVAMSDAEFLSKVRSPPPLPALLEAGRSWAARPLADLPTAGDLWFHGDAESTLLEVVRAGFRVTCEWPSRPSPLAPRRAAANPVHHRIAVFDILPMEEEEEGANDAARRGTSARPGAAATPRGATEGAESVHGPEAAGAAGAGAGAVERGEEVGSRNGAPDDAARPAQGGDEAGDGRAAAAAARGGSPASAGLARPSPLSPESPSGGRASSHAPLPTRASSSPPPPGGGISATSLPPYHQPSQLDLLLDRRARIESLASASSNALSRLALGGDGDEAAAAGAAGATRSDAATASALALGRPDASSATHPSASRDALEGLSLPPRGVNRVSAPARLRAAGSHPRLASSDAAGDLSLAIAAQAQAVGSPPAADAAGLGLGLGSPTSAGDRIATPSLTPPPAARLPRVSPGFPPAAPSDGSQGSAPSAPLPASPSQASSGFGPPSAGLAPPRLPRHAPGSLGGSTSRLDALPWVSWGGSAGAGATPPPQGLRSSQGSLVSDLLGGGGLDGRSSGLVKCLSATDLTSHGAGGLEEDMQPTPEQREAAAAAAARLLAATAGNARAFDLPQPPAVRAGAGGSLLHNASSGLLPGPRPAALGSLASAVAASTGNLAAYMQGGGGAAALGGRAYGWGLAQGYAQGPGGAFASVPSGLHALQSLQQQQQQLALQQQSLQQQQLELQRRLSQPPPQASPAPSSSVADLSEDDDDDDEGDDIDDEDLDEATDDDGEEEDDDDDDDEEHGEGASSAWRAPDRAHADAAAGAAPAAPHAAAQPPPFAPRGEARLTPRGSFAGQSSGLSGPSLSARSLSSEARSLSGGSALGAQLLASTLPSAALAPGGGSPQGAGVPAPVSSPRGGAPSLVTSPRSAAQRRGRSTALRSLDAALRVTKSGKERGKERAASLGRAGSSAALHAKASAMDVGAEPAVAPPGPGALPGSPPVASPLSGLFPLHPEAAHAGLRPSSSSQVLHASLSAQHLAALQQQHLQQQRALQQRILSASGAGAPDALTGGLAAAGGTPTPTPPPPPPPSRLSSSALHALPLSGSGQWPGGAGALPGAPGALAAPPWSPGSRPLPRSSSGWQIRAVISQTDVVRLLLANVDRLDLSFDCSIEQLGLVQGTGQVSSVPADTPALAAFALLQRHALSGLALVDRQNRLVGSLAASDLRGIDADRVALLRLPALEYVAFRAAHVMATRDPDDAVVRAACEGDMRVVAEAVAKAGSRVPQLVEVSPKDSLRRVAELLVANTKRRVYVVDAQGVAIGVVTPTDILRLVSG